MPRGNQGLAPSGRVMPPSGPTDESTGSDPNLPGLAIPWIKFMMEFPYLVHGYAK